MTKEQECMKALQCLYLEVPSVIADDIKQKVIDALNEVKKLHYTTCCVSGAEN